MRQYECLCGATIFFDNSCCIACGHELGFCPVCRLLVALTLGADGEYQCGNPACGASLVKCFNYSEHNVCNRCVAAASPLENGSRKSEPAGTAAQLGEVTAPPIVDVKPLCDCCRFNATVPDLSVAGNWEKWQLLEAAKRRLFYDLDLLGLPYGTTSDGIEPALTFDFKADVIPAGGFWRTVGKADRVYTGHAGGRITINIREADTVEREKLRVDFGEAKRTLIGHFRHEIGHYYWDQLVKGRREEACRAVFGDHDNPSYADALDQYYKDGPPANWSQQFISAYATMHPWEDFAETWATYLDMVSELDTAQNVGFGGEADPVHADLTAMVHRYQQLGIALNEISRSMGLIDLVPEVFVAPVIVKLEFIHQLALEGRAENRILNPVAVTS